MNVINPNRQARSSTRPEHQGAPVVFVVDDDPSTLDLLCEVARDSGWRSVGFTHLATLRSALAESRPALLIIDDDLPDGRGGDLARDLRGNARLEGVPVLVCTAATPLRQAEIGAFAPVISKPFELGEIENFLAAAVRRNGDVHAYRGTAG